MKQVIHLAALFLLFASEAVFACRPRFWSPQEAASTAPVIFIVEVTSKQMQGEASEWLNLKLIETLKGAAPNTLTTVSTNIKAIGDLCMTVEAPEWKRAVGVGEKWILFGNFSTSANQFQPSIPAILYEENSPYLADLRRAIQRSERLKK